MIDKYANRIIQGDCLELLKTLDFKGLGLPLR